MPALLVQLIEFGDVAAKDMVQGDPATASKPQLATPSRWCPRLC